MFLLEKINISSVQKYLGINVLRAAHPAMEMAGRSYLLPRQKNFGSITVRGLR